MTTVDDTETTAPAARTDVAARTAPAATAEAATASGARRVRPPRPGKPNGQWKVDGKDPLNSTEEIKNADDGLNVRERIEKIYAVQGFDSIDPDDLRGRFRWYGIYTQRRQGIDGGRTASLAPEELEDRFFMMRIRIDFGRLTTEQVRVIGEVSRDFARNTADISDRQNVQLHWVEIENIPEIWRRLEEVGLRTTEACGDGPRVMLGSPVAGIAEDEIIDPSWAMHELSTRYIGDPRFSNLPRKYKTSITGHPSLDAAHEINDCSFVGVRHPELGPGFDLWVGGALSSTPRLAERVGAFVSEERVCEVWEGVTGIFRDYGYRRLRNKARMKFLLADWGPEKFRQVLEDEYLGYRLPDGPAPQKATEPGDHVGVHRQKDGRYYIGAATTVGRSSGTTLIELADAVERHGSTRVRTTAFQKVLVLDIEEEKVDSMVAELERLGLAVHPGPFRRTTMACTGLEFCKLAIVDTKNTAADAITALEERLADIEVPQPIALHINGCPNSCARIQSADIGLKGQIVTDADGVQHPGFQVHLGGGLASHRREEAALGRTVRGLKVRADELVDYVERLVRRFVAERGADETFAEWAVAADEEALR